MDGDAKAALDQFIWSVFRLHIHLDRDWRGNNECAVHVDFRCVDAQSCRYIIGFGTFDFYSGHVGVCIDWLDG